MIKFHIKKVANNDWPPIKYIAAGKVKVLKSVNFKFLPLKWYASINLKLKKCYLIYTY